MTGTSDAPRLRLPLTVRVAASLFLFLGVAFGASVPFVLRISTATASCR